MKWQTKALLFIALGVSTAALAKHVGRFYCGTSCEVGAGLASGDTYTYILGTVNKSVERWIDSNGDPNTVTICNGTKCSIYTYVKLSGQFIAEGYFYSTWTDSGGGSEAGGPSGGGGGGGGSGSTGGGNMPPGGCYGNCSGGTVTVRPIEKP